MRIRCKWVILLTVTLLLFSSSEAQQRRRDSNQPTNTARSSTAYDAYVGQYLLPGSGPERGVITITRIGNRLIAETSRLITTAEGNVFELFPQSENEFARRSKDETLSFTFIKDANGHVPQLIFTRGYPDNRISETANRISSLIPYTPSPKQLLEYVGQYQVKSGGPINEYIVEDGVLKVFDRGMARNGVVEKLGLFPDTEDRFLLKKRHVIITFMRDDRGMITAVEVVKSPSYKFVARKL